MGVRIEVFVDLAKAVRDLLLHRIGDRRIGARASDVVELIGRTGQRTDFGCEGAAQAGIRVRGLGREAIRQAAQHARRIGVATRGLRTNTAVVFMTGLQHHIDGRAIARRPAQGAAHRIVAAAIDLVVDAGAGVQRRIDVLDRAVAVFPEARNAQAQLAFDDRDVHHPTQLFKIVIAVGGFRVGVEIVDVRLGGDDVDRTAGGVTAIQRALRTAQNFDALGVVIGPARQRRRRQIDVVFVDGHAGVTGCGDGGRTDAADLEVGGAEVAVREGHVRNRELEVLEALDLMGREIR